MFRRCGRCGKIIWFAKLGFPLWVKNQVAFPEGVHNRCYKRVLKQWGDNLAKELGDNGPAHM